MIQIGDPTRADTTVQPNHDVQLGPLVLRMSGHEWPERVIRLESPKCTIGSDRGCTLQLEVPGIHPVQCLIIRGRRRTVVRRWSPNTLLNGSAFVDAELRQGDRLEIGPIEMEVLEANPLPELPQPPNSQNTQNTPANRNITRQLNLARREGRRRAKDLLAELRGARNEIKQLRGQLDEQHQQIESRRAVLDERQRQVERQEAELEEDRRQLEAHRAELDVRQTEFERCQQQWEQTRRDPEQSQRAEHEPIPSDTSAESAAQTTAAQAALEAERERFENEKRQWEIEVNTHKNDWERQQHELEEQRRLRNAKHMEVEARLSDWERELDARQADLEKQTLAVEGPPAAAGPRIEPTPLAAKIVSPPLESEKKTDTQSTGPQIPETAADSDATTFPTNAAQEDAPKNKRAESGKEDDGSIDEYMSQLLERLNVITGAETKETAPILKPSVASRQAFLGANHPYRQKSKEEESEEEEAARTKTAKPRRHHSALEGISLSAMRELATATAVSAITAHKRNQMQRKIRGKLLLAVGALALSASLVIGWFLWHFQSWHFYAGVVGLFLAFLWVIQYVILHTRLHFGQSNHSGRNDSPTGAEDSPSATNAAAAQSDDAPTTNDQPTANS
ncbi:MAG: hypothetical protein JW719_05440 [Pirellulales bacterium]|nr:hypothetical protein [Pirellulales bacterium]